MSGKQIKLSLIDGTPGGLTTAGITNWTGHVLSARRSDLADLLKRDEAQRTGAYVLLGDEAAGGNTRCYIGEADIVADRLRYHQREKDFWDRVVVITSKDANFTKAHARYLESRLISLATDAGRVTLDNGTAPTVPALPEADASDMDYFVSQLQIVLPVLGVNAIRVPLPDSSTPALAEATHRFSPRWPCRTPVLRHKLPAPPFPVSESYLKGRPVRRCTGGRNQVIRIGRVHHDLPVGVATGSHPAAHPPFA